MREGDREPLPGRKAMRDPISGTAEVRSGLHRGREEAYEALHFARESGTQARERVRGAASAARDRAESLGTRARDLAEDLQSRATDAASTARERLSEIRARTNRTLERRGVVDRLRENPLPILGVAFAIGFLLAGSEERGSQSRGARARRELRGALMAGLSAGIAQGARAFFSEAGSEGSSFVSSLLDGLAGERSRGGGERRERRDRYAEEEGDGGRVRGITHERF